MTDQQFIELLRSRQAELQRLFSRTLPIKVGALAKAHFQQNFRLGGFDQYPVTFPCVLISTPEASWVTHSDHQKCTVVITVRLALDVYEDTRYGCGQEQGILERANQARELNN